MIIKDDFNPKIYASPMLLVTLFSHNSNSRSIKENFCMLFLLISFHLGIAFASFRDVLELSLLMRKRIWATQTHHLRTFELFQRISSSATMNSHIDSIMKAKFLVYEYLVLHRLTSNEFRDTLLTRSLGSLCPSTEFVKSKEDKHFYFSPEILTVIDPLGDYKLNTKLTQHRSFDLNGLLKANFNKKPLREVYALGAICHWNKFHNISTALQMNHSQILSIKSVGFPMKILEERINTYVNYILPELPKLDHSKSFKLTMASFHLLNYFKYLFWLLIPHAGGQEDRFILSKETRAIFLTIKKLWISYEQIIDLMIKNLFQQFKLIEEVGDSKCYSIIYQKRLIHLRDFKIVIFSVPTVDPNDLEYSMNLTELINGKRVSYRGGEVAELYVYCSSNAISSREKIIERAKEYIMSLSKDRAVE